MEQNDNHGKNKHNNSGEGRAQETLESLREEKKQYQMHIDALQRITQVGSWELVSDDDGVTFRPLYWSDETFRILGYDPENTPMSAVNFFSRIHPDDMAIYLSIKKNAIDNNRAFDDVFRLLMPDGQVKIVRAVFDVSRDAATGKVVKATGAIQDITEREASNHALKKAHREMNILFGNMPAVFFSVDTVTNTLLQVTPACQDIYGYTTDAFYANPNLWLESVLDEDKGQIYALFPAMQQGQTIEPQYRIRHRNGAIKWLECKMIPTLNADGQLIRIDGYTSDISERVQHEIELKQSNEELRKSNQELDLFVYSVSHDLRAPLMSLQGLLELGQQAGTADEMQEYLQLMQQSTKKLDGFILDILDYARNKRGEVKREQLDFKRMVNDVIDNLKFMSRDNSPVDIRIDIQDSGHFYSDTSRVGIIMNNLISNAIRYYNPGEADPYVEIQVQQNDNKALVSVKDNGIGISKENQERIFEMFFRASATSVGSGLGLYIVKETVEKLGGSIHLESEPGKGTSIKVMLPNLA